MPGHLCAHAQTLHLLMTKAIANHIEILSTGCAGIVVASVAANSADLPPVLGCVQTRVSLTLEGRNQGLSVALPW